jgi:hypothetical protein
VNSHRSDDVEYITVWAGRRTDPSLCSDDLRHSTLTALVEESAEAVRHRHKTNRPRGGRSIRQGSLDAAKREIRERHGELQQVTR